MNNIKTNIISYNKKIYCVILEKVYNILDNGQNAKGKDWSK